MVPLNILRTGFEAVLMRSHAAKYAACVVLACAAAVVVAVPVFGQTTSVTLVGAGDIANCNHNNDEAQKLACRMLHSRGVRYGRGAVESTWRL